MGPGIEEGPHSGLNFVEENNDRTAGGRACVAAGNCRYCCPVALGVHALQHLKYQFAAGGVQQLEETHRQQSLRW